MRSEQEYSGNNFSGHDRRRLAKAMSSASEWHWFQRAQAVLRVAEGYTIAEAAYWAGVDCTSVYRGTQRYLAARPVQDWADAPRSGRPQRAPVLTKECWIECWPATRAQTLIKRRVGPFLYSPRTGAST